jgi:hypothetical protein
MTEYMHGYTVKPMTTHEQALVMHKTSVYMDMTTGSKQIKHLALSANEDLERK